MAFRRYAVCVIRIINAMKTGTAIYLHSIKLVDRVKVLIPCEKDIFYNEECLCTAGAFLSVSMLAPSKRYGLTVA